MAIRYVGSHPDVSTLQVGIATAGQFQKAAEAINKGALPENILAQICNAQSGFAA